MLVVAMTNSAVPGLMVLAALAVIGISLYNAFGRGIAAYEARLDEDVPDARGARYCTKCGRTVAVDDRFCSSCGAPRVA